MRHLSFSAFAHTRRGHTLLAAGAMLAISVIAGAALQPALSLRPRYRGAPALAARGAVRPPSGRNGSICSLSTRRR